MSKEEDLLQGKVCWEIQQKEYGPLFCNQIEEAVRMIGADNYYKLMEPYKHKIPQNACDLMLLSLKYVEHKQKENAIKN